MAKIVVSLADGFLKRIDRVARSKNRSRTELIREALRMLLKAEADRGGSWQDALAPLRDLEHRWVGRWDSADIIRYYRHRRYGREARR